MQSQTSEESVGSSPKRSLKTGKEMGEENKVSRIHVFASAASGKKTPK